MKKISKTIVFFGSGPVAAKSLQLLSKTFIIEAVITKPRPLHHKGPVPVIDVSTHLQIPIITVADKHQLDAVISKNTLKSELGILIDFGIIVSQEVIDFFPLGIINSHFSLLPELRGADPITFSILRGDKKTGVSLMLVDKGMDTGKILSQKTVHLPQDITTPELTEKLIAISNDLLNEIIPQYLAGTITPRQQPHPDRATYSRKLTKADGVLDWQKSAQELEQQIRAFIEWPGSRTTLYGKDVIITKAQALASKNTDEVVGAVTYEKEAGVLGISTSFGTLNIERLKPAGKNEMSVPDFMHGIKTT
jgi:methionyl-tRNA formyltransferase